MTMLLKDYLALLPACAGVYAAAYAEEPWGETFDPDALQAYLRRFAEADDLSLYIYLHENEPIGIALVSIVPCIGSDFARIEDFCIAPAFQRKGMGSRFMSLLCGDLRARGCDSVLLATQQNFPSHHFYMHCGFVPLNSSVQLYREI